jgi:hypothetical protein
MVAKVRREGSESDRLSWRHGNYLSCFADRLVGLDSVGVAGFSQGTSRKQRRPWSLAVAIQRSSRPGSIASQVT